jgi:hypothetical protein
MADNFPIIVFFIGVDGVEHAKLIKSMNFGGRLSVLLERIPSLMCDVLGATPRADLRLRAAWLGERDWSVDLEVSRDFENCLLVMVDENLVARGVDFWTMTGEMATTEAGLTLRRRSAASPPSSAYAGGAPARSTPMNIAPAATQPIYEARSVQEAIQLAEHFKREGRYNWFRGQKCNWSVVPTFGRLAEADVERETDRLARFEMWVKETPALRDIARDINAILAVAQHYHLPTNFVDFTTEPAIAGQFAVVGDGERGRESCIICLDTRDLAEFWETLVEIPEERQRYPIDPKFVTIDVRNLWRLQAQHGVFLSLPYVGFEKAYRFDRIFFPPSDVPPFPLEDIYPKRKSDLEKMLDQWFMLEEMRKGNEHLAQMRQSMPVGMVKMDTASEADQFFSGPLQPHASWKNLSDQWTDTVASESYRSVLTSQAVDIDMRPMFERPGNAAGQRARLQPILAEFLRRNPDSRKRLVRWRFLVPMAPPVAELCAGGAEALWDGMRGLPYSDDQIAAAMAAYSVLSVLYETELAASPYDVERATTAAVDKLFGESIEIEFGSGDGSYSRGHAAKRDIIGSLRNDLATLLLPKHKQRLSTDVRSLLFIVRSPQLLFDFSHLVWLFAEQILPSQAVFRSRASAKVAHYYSPAQCSALGLP